MTPEQTQLAIFFAIGFVLLALAIWIALRANRKTNIIVDDSEPLGKDVLDEGAARAARNQALIDSQAAVEVASTPIPDAPEPEPVAAPIPASTASADDLRMIKGLGPKIVTILAEQGVTSFAQIAAWTDADIERVDATLGRFAGRITRDQWVEQAKFLAQGDQTGFSEKFGQNG
ncbi:hypothetical protein [uncultured Erythrobacter sp.]|uniref:hypothetical protein n=1 Tax=uncultured Erythrobacter sp. TaxID=263913 RepID=UPI0026223F72|nr:hypothetical protein [uncultured Erythrobacter sp.]